MLRERQKRILMILYQAEKYLTFQNIADELKVSVKTVRNDVAVLKDYVQNQKAGEIQTKPRRGVWYQVNDGGWEKIQTELQDNEKMEVNDDADILYTMLHQLLKKKSISISELAKKLYVSRALVEKHYQEARSWMEEHHILVEKKQGIGIGATAEEYYRRLALWEFFQEFQHFLEGELKTEVITRGEISGSEYQAMTALLDGFDIKGVTDALSEIEAEFGFHYRYDSNVRTIFLVSLALIQTRKKVPVKVPKPEQYKTDGTFDRQVLELLNDSLEQYYQLKIPEAEKEFICFVLAISQVQEFTDEDSRLFYQHCHTELCILTIRFVRLAGEISNTELVADNFFNEQMFLELKVMIERLKYGMPFRNPFLKQMRTKYPNIMAAAWAASVFLDKELGLEISEDEVGLIALHLGGAIERNINALKACIICDYGIGISQILKEKIERTINDIKITEVLSYRDIRQIRKAECDFIISTLPDIELPVDKEIITVDHMLQEADICNIEKKMKGVRRRKVRMKEQKADIHLKWQLFNEKFFYAHMKVKDKEELLRKLSLNMEIMGYVTDGFAESVMERESKTSTEVGNMVALPHGSPKHVIRSVVSVVLLDEPILWHKDTAVDIVFLLAIGSDEPKVMQNEIIKFYKSFVTFIDSENGIEELKETRDFNKLIELFQI